MRLVDLPRTTSFQLALRFLLLFGAASIALCGFLYWQTTYYIEAGIDDWLSHEQAVLAVVQSSTLVKRLEAHVVADPTLERPLTLFTADGTRLAGTHLAMTAAELTAVPMDSPFRFVFHQGAHPFVFRGLAHRRPDGDVLLVARDMEPSHKFVEVLTHAFIIGGLATTFLGLTGAAVVGFDAMRRLDGVTRSIQRIVGGDLSERLPTHGRADDLDRLVLVINGMLGALERLMQEVKGVCDNVAHDLRTPLTRLLAGLERTRRHTATAEDYAAAIDDAILETRDVLKTFAAILRISEVESGARRAGFTDTDLCEVVADAAELFEPMAEAKGVRLLLASSDSPALMRGDPSLLFEAVGNLIENALKFTPQGGCVTVLGFARAGTVGFEVVDTGPGIQADERDAVLRRFYRGETSRHTEGSGLGLALVAAVARLHGMELTIRDALPGCRITLVRHDGADSGIGKQPPADPANSNDIAMKPAAE